MTVSLEYGCFLPPSHSPGVSPHTALHQDIELCCLADDLGFDEVWLGEHHSGAWTTLACPDLLIAALARETRRVRFATGVIPLPYHHPVHTAERILLLDHLTAGRAILGCGTGSYVHDMEMIGVDPEAIRPHFRAALDVIQGLIHGDTVDASTPWFTARNAVLQLRPLKGHIDIVIATSLSDNAIDLLVDTGTAPSVNLTAPWGVIRAGSDPDPVGTTLNRIAKYRAMTKQQQKLRCNVYVHVAESAPKGIDELMPGWVAQRAGLYRKILGMPIPGSEAAHRRALESLVESGAFVVGDPAKCADQLRDLAERIGPLSSIVFTVPGWLEHRAAAEQLKVLAREVIPTIRGDFHGTSRSIELVSAEAGRQIRRRDAVIIRDGTVQMAKSSDGTATESVDLVQMLPT